MKPVLIPQERLVVITAEDSYRAALASILDLELEDVPTFEGLSAQIQFHAWLAADLNLCPFTLPQMMPPPGFWLARVQSPYPEYSVHTVVMRSQQIIHDPHPEQKLRPGGEAATVLECELLLPLDPSQPSGRLAG